MKTIILVAGKGPRMLPLTNDTPQCLLKVNNKTILEIQLESLENAGIKSEEVVIITGYLSKKVELLCEEFGIKSLFNPFYEVSGMALTLWMARKELKEGFIFLYGDVLLDYKIINNLLENENEICLAIKKNGIREEAEKVLEEEGAIKRISKKETFGKNGEFIGIAKFSPLGANKLVEELERIARINLKTSFIKVINNLIQNGELIAAYDIGEAKFIDIDFPEDLEKAERMLV